MTSSTMRVSSGAGGRRRSCRHVAQPLKCLLRCGAAGPFEAVGVLPVEVETRPRHVDREPQPRRQRDVDQVCGDVVHRPSVTQRRPRPLLIVEAGEVVDQRAALGVDERPDIVGHAG